MPRPSREAGQWSSNELHPKPGHDYGLRRRPSNPCAPRGCNHRAAYFGAGAEGRPGRASRAPGPLRGRRPCSRRAREIPQRTRLISTPYVRRTKADPWPRPSSRPQSFSPSSHVLHHHIDPRGPGQLAVSRQHRHTPGSRRRYVEGVVGPHIMPVPPGLPGELPV